VTTHQRPPFDERRIETPLGFCPPSLPALVSVYLDIRVFMGFGNGQKDFKGEGHPWNIVWIQGKL
jgi:hypothetical protein